MKVGENRAMSPSAPAATGYEIEPSFLRSLLRQAREKSSWRVLLARFVVSGFAVAITALILPGIHVGGDSVILTFVVFAVVFGALNALVRPVLQILTLPLLWITYGLIVLVINTLILWLGEQIAPSYLQIESFGWLVVAGVVYGALGFLLEGVLGVTEPIADPQLAREGAGRSARA